MFSLPGFGFPLGLWFSFGFLVFPVGLSLGFSFESTFVFFLQSLCLCLSFGFKGFIFSFGCAYAVIRRRRGVFRKMGEGGVVAGKSISHHHRHSA